MALPLRRVRPWLAGTVLALAGALTLADLGHYALWDDEANTALSALGVVRTGDTTAWVSDHNLLAFRHGAELDGLHLRYIPPLQAFLAATSLAWLGPSAFAARLPFALCGIAAIALMLLWLWRGGAGTRLWVLMALGLVGSVSLFLYMRQCRYYAPALLATLAVAYCYVRRPRGWPWLIALASIAVLASNYLNYFALYACLAVDYLGWGRRDRPLDRREALTLLVPQLAAAALLVPIWNPLALDVAGIPDDDWLEGRLALLAGYLRDLTLNEFIALPVLLAAPFVWKRDDAWARRALAALAVYVLAIVLVAPTVASREPAAMRYIVPVLPLCIFISAAVVEALTRRSALITGLAGVLLFGTNVVHGGALAPGGVRSTLAAYIVELAEAPTDPYTETVAWINANVPPGASIWVMPAYMKYPLMFHAPQAVYAWQLAWPPTAQFEHLAPIHFEGREPPDYLVAFGPADARMAASGYLAGAERVAVLDVHWRDVYRPELNWRLFEARRSFDRVTEAVYIYKRLPPGAVTSDSAGNSTKSADR